MCLSLFLVVYWQSLPFLVLQMHCSGLCFISAWHSLRVYDFLCPNFPFLYGLSHIELGCCCFH